MPLTAKDISHVPPHDTAGQMKKAATLLGRFRKALSEGDITQPGGNGLSVEWQRWIAESLLAGLPKEDESG